ncbi:MAG: hypothetical protein RI965_1031 [Bacteroidota bacterium]|jgi:hypothetical protein
MYLRAILWATICLLCFEANAQFVSVGSVIMEDRLRDLQLLDKIPQEYSFANRPYSLTKNFSLDSLYKSIDQYFYNNSIFHHNILNKKHFKFVLLPAELTQQLNTRTPYGYNDGSFLKARGYQVSAMAGFYLKAGPLEVQAQPNITYSQNNSYYTTASWGSKTYPNIFKKYPGQTEASINFGPISGGISTANRWYGPGIHNSIMLSNNAPGFANVFIRTKRPLKTPIGSFEWTLSTGWLHEDSLYAFENYRMQPFSNRNRRMLYNGLMISHQPKWFKGMHVGLIRAYDTKSASNFNSDQFKNSNFVDKYLPVFTVLTKSKIIYFEDAKERDQQASLFMRWVSTKDHFEWYAEYGWNDHSINMRDLIMGPGHSAVYLTGLKKIVPLQKANEYFNFELEYMRGQQLAEYIVRDAGNWNWHGNLQSFTNMNQYLGSAVGGGNNTIHLLTSYHKGWKRYALSFEKITNDPLYFPKNKWIDFITGLTHDRTFGNLMIQSQFKFVHQKNYGWQAGKKINNIFASVGLKYLF